jgi:hypothetical protein
MAVGALAKSCAKVSTCRSCTLMALRCKSSLPCQCTAHICTSCLQMLDCTDNPDGTSTLDTLPDMICWEGNHSLFAAMGAAGLLLYSVLVPRKLFLTVKGSAADGKWTEQELESHGWLLLKVSTKPLAACCLASAADASVSILV